MEKILKKIGQLQYEISCLELDKETLTGVTIRMDELKELVKNYTIHDTVGRSEQLLCGEPEKATYREIHFNKCDICGKPIKQTKSKIK